MSDLFYELQVTESIIEEAEKAFDSDMELIAESRPKIIKFVEYLKDTDYFEAPASLRYHLSCPFGLFIHSYNVVRAMKQMNEAMNLGLDEASIALVGWFHDLCKVNRTKQSSRNKKNKQGRWVQVGGYEFCDKLPLGHGNKSVFMLMSKGIKLTTEEALAITHHMGHSHADNFEIKSAMEASWEKYPLALIAHLADLFAAYQLDVSEDCVIKQEV